MPDPQNTPACPLCLDLALHVRAEGLSQTMSDVQVDAAMGLPAGTTGVHLDQHGRPAEDQAKASAPEPEEPTVSRAQMRESFRDLRKGAWRDSRAREGGSGHIDLTERLEAYLGRVEGILDGIDDSDPRNKIGAIDQARKTCESIAKIHLDLMRAQLDVQVQQEFRRIVMEAINDTAPEVRQRIVSEIQSRARAFGVLGGLGCGVEPQGAEPGGDCLPEESA